mmetsp:Transcript_30222/g.72543  ORF Transcript_30222/g.72543 Transcript_30222/m.72543 type:complete len:223 (-) Transcript_30222:457-1125(-)
MVNNFDFSGSTVCRNRIRSGPGGSFMTLCKKSSLTCLAYLSFCFLSSGVNSSSCLNNSSCNCLASLATRICRICSSCGSSMIFFFGASELDPSPTSEYWTATTRVTPPLSRSDRVVGPPCKDALATAVCICTMSCRKTSRHSWSSAYSQVAAVAGSTKMRVNSLVTKVGSRPTARAKICCTFSNRFCGYAMAVGSSFGTSKSSNNGVLSFRFCSTHSRVIAD